MRTEAALGMPTGRPLIGLAMEDEDMVRSVEDVLISADKYDAWKFSGAEIDSGAWPEENFHAIVASSSAIRNYRGSACIENHRVRPIIVILNSDEFQISRDSIIYSDSFVLFDRNISRLPNLIVISRHKLAIMPDVERRGSTRINRKISMLNNLPDRERLVLAELSRGTGNRQIASRLNLTVSMVKDHIRQIIGRLGFRNRTDAGVFAAAYLFDDTFSNTTSDDE